MLKQIVLTRKKPICLIFYKHVIKHPMLFNVIPNVIPDVQS